MKDNPLEDVALLVDLVTNSLSQIDAGTSESDRKAIGALKQHPRVLIQKALGITIPLPGTAQPPVPVTETVMMPAPPPPAIQTLLEDVAEIKKDVKFITEAMKKILGEENGTSPTER